MRAVVFAGGKGTRLAPFTTVLPKPLIPIGDRSILELILGQLAAHGVDEAILCVGYLSHLIRAVCESKDDLDLTVRYVLEEQPLGTAAPLRLVEGLDDDFLAMNGDILTTIDYGDFLKRHAEAGNILTIATHERRTKLDYGVLHLDSSGPGGHRVVGFEEKPQFTLNVSMGIYAMSPRLREFIPSEGAFDIPDLVLALLEAGERIGAYPYSGFWLDLGRPEDYEAAVSWERDRHLLIRQGLIPA